MNYYTAPMEGLTDRIWRQAHQRWFGAPGAPARYYAPFISPPENRVLIKKKMAELDPAANPGAPVIRRSLLAGRRPHLGQDPAGRHQPGGIRSHPRPLRPLPHL